MLMLKLPHGRVITSLRKQCDEQICLNLRKTILAKDVMVNRLWPSYIVWCIEFSWVSPGYHYQFAWLYILMMVMQLLWVIFTRGQFWPSGIVVACVCPCVHPSVRVCGNHLLVHAITHRPFKLGSPNFDHRCKIPWLRSQLFWGWLTLTFKVKFNFKVKSYPILSLSAW